MNIIDIAGINCPVCDSEVDLFELPYPMFRHMDHGFHRPGPKHVAHCFGCGLIFRVAGKKALREIGEIYRSFEYSATAANFHLVSQGSETALQARTVLRHVQRRGAVLDVGCFDGRLLDELHRAGFGDCFGVDLRKHHLLPEHVRFFPDIGRIGHTFDLVTATGSIQYLPDLNLFFRTVAGLLKEDGVLFIQTTNIHTKPLSMVLGDLYYHFSADILRRIGARHGFIGRLLQPDWNTRDIVMLLKKGIPDSLPPVQDDVRLCLERIKTLRGHLDGIGQEETMVFGTTLEASFVEHFLGGRTVGFVDENENKKNFKDKPVIHPSAVAEGRVVLVPMFEIGRELTARLNREYAGRFVNIAE